MTKIWWVTQSHKINGRIVNEVVWSPGVSPDDPSQLTNYKLMWKAQVGDIIIHYSSEAQQIVALSRVLTPASPAANPFADDDNTWQLDGKQLNVDLTRLEVPINKSDIPLEVRKAASGPYQPFEKSGEKLKQKGYFFPVPMVLWEAIASISGAASDQMIAAGSEVNHLSGVGATDISYIVRGRTEQAQLRQRLLAGRSEEKCGICGEIRPTRYLRAAHIKQRSTASDAERRNPHIAMLAYVLGCDQAFENGDIRVQDNGEIVLGNPNDTFLQSQFGMLVGQVAPAFNENNKPFFEARYSSFN